MSNTQNNSSESTPEFSSHTSSVIAPLSMPSPSTQSSTACLLANNSSPSPLDLIPPSLSTQQLSTSSTGYNIDTIQQCADTTNGLSMITSDLLLSDDIPSSSSFTPQLSTATTDSDTTHQCTDTTSTENECAQDLIAITTGQNEHWINTTSNDCLEEVRDASTAAEGSLDLTMMCDIQRIVSRLIAMIGSVKTGLNYSMYYI